VADQQNTTRDIRGKHRAVEDAARRRHFMRILITGACGFVGSRVGEHLLERVEGLRIAGIDNLMRPGSETNRIRLERLGVEFVHGDLRSASDVAGLPECDWVIDAAANPSVVAGLDGAGSSRRLFEHNLAALGNVLEYCREHSAGLLLLSSSRVYSVAALSAIPLRECGAKYAVDERAPMPPGVSPQGIGVYFSTAPPVSLYGATKLASEIMALEYGAAFGFPVWITRCGVIAGAGQFGTPDQGILSFWINAHLRRCPLRYVGFDGTGRQTRDALHPRDLAALLTAEIRCERSVGPRVYTAGGGPKNSISLAQLTAWCDDKFGRHVPGADLRARPYDVGWIAMDNTQTACDFGWNIEMPLGCILEEIAEHARTHPEWLEVSRA
jgi:CDP-paratose 2-epimerase